MKCPKCLADNPDDSLYCVRCGTRIISAKDWLESPTLTFPGSAERLVPGSVFAGRYKIIEDLGEGGMGSVYKVFDTEIKERLALKLILPAIASDGRIIERFQKELKLARAISHKNICKTYHLGKEKDAYFITMEYVEGESLKSIMRMTKRLSLATALQISKQVSDGLEEAHRKGVIHRDLKPDNIMVDKEGNVRIMDFGLARSLQTEKGTRAGVILGTPEYMSPEQAEGRDVDGRSDIYSLGILLYEMVTGRVPFEGSSTMDVLSKQINEPPQAPRTLNPEIPDSLNLLILRCLKKNREERYQTADALHHALDGIEAEFRTTETRAGRKKTSASREITVSFELKRIALPLLLLILVAATGILMWRFLPRHPRPPVREGLDVAVITFANQTGDPKYDYLQEAIPNLLITSLEQYEHVRVATWERLMDLLKRMGREKVRVITSELGFELCRRDRIDMIVLGSYVKAGEMFAADAKVYDVRSKSLITSVSTRGEGVDSILKKQIDELRAGISRALAEAEPTTQVTATPISEVTTESMEAYNNFLEGRDAFENANSGEARKNLEKAVEIDPDFSLAYIYLARASSLAGDTAAARAAIEEYRRHGRKVPGREGLYLDGLAAKYIDLDLEKHFQIMQKLVVQYPKEKRARAELAEDYEIKRMIPEAKAQWEKALEIDPRFSLALNSLAYLYLRQSQYDKALEYLQKYAAAYPDEANPRDSIGDAYLLMGKYDAAVKKYKEALKIRPDFGSDSKIGYCHALKEDYDQALRWNDQFIAVTPSNAIKAMGYLLKGFYYQVLGRFEEALREWDAAEALLRTVKDDYLINIVKRNRLWACYDWGKLDLFISRARERMEHRLTSGLGSAALNTAYLKYYEGFYSLGRGELDSAETKLKEVEAFIPQALNEQETRSIQEAFYHLSAEILLARGKADEAVAEFEKMPRESLVLTSLPTITNVNMPFRDDFGARALAGKGDLDGAIAEYERILRPAFGGGHLLHPLAHYRLAKLCEQKGLHKRAIKEYNRVVDIWKDGDPDLAEVKDARAKLAALRRR